MCCATDRTERAKKESAHAKQLIEKKKAEAANDAAPAATSRAPPILKASKKGELETLFSKIDVDNGGTLDKNELFTALENTKRCSGGCL